MKNNILLLIWVLVFNADASFADLLDEDEPVVTPKKPVEEVKGPEKPENPETKPIPSPAAPGKGPIKPAVKTGPVNNPSNQAAPGSGKEKPKNGNGKTAEPAVREPVHFESKGLRGLRDKGTVELIEDVIVTQGDLRLEADRAQIFYDESQKEVAKVVAEGNVKIFNVEKSTGEKMKAYSNQVQFNNTDRTVIMEGNARLWRGSQSVIRGKKITYEIDTGWIRADRVAGELQPEEKKK